MASVTAIELGADTCAFARTSVRRGEVRLSAAEILDPTAFPGMDALTVAVRQVRRSLRLPRRCRVVLWGLPDGANRKDPAVWPLLAPLVGAGFKVERVVTPCNALAALARLKASRGDGSMCWLAINRGGVAIVVVRPGKLLYAHSFAWDSSVGTSGSQARLLQRYSLVSFLSPEVKRAMAEARKYGSPVDAVITCGNLPDLRSLTMPLIEELDVEVETLDSLEGLVVKPQAVEKLAESAPAIRLACAAAIARGTRPRDDSKRGAGSRRTAAYVRAAILAAAVVGIAYAWYVTTRPSTTPTNPAVSARVEERQASRIPAAPPAVATPPPAQGKPPLVTSPPPPAKPPAVITAPPVVATPPPAQGKPPLVTSPPPPVKPPAVITAPPVVATPPPQGKPPLVTSPPPPAKPPAVITAPPAQVKRPLVTAPPPQAKAPVVTAPPTPMKAPVVTAPPSPAKAPAVSVPAPAVSVPAKRAETNPPVPSRLERRDARGGTPGNAPRSPVLDPRTQAPRIPLQPLVTAPSPNTPAPVVPQPAAGRVPPPAVSAPAKKPESNPPVPSRLEGREARGGTPGNAPRSSVLAPRTPRRSTPAKSAVVATPPPAVSVPARKPESNPPVPSRIEGRDQRVGTPGSTPRSSVLAPRTPQRSTPAKPAVVVAPSPAVSVPATKPESSNPTPPESNPPGLNTSAVAADKPGAGVATRPPSLGAGVPRGPMPALLKDAVPKVTAILVSRDRRFATVDGGQIVGIGDLLGRRTVVGMDERSVVLQEPSGVQIRIGLGGRLLGVERAAR